MPAVVKAFIERHIQHIKYPSKKSEIVAACAGMAEIPRPTKNGSNRIFQTETTNRLMR
jgi:hypothetical protein